MFIKNTWKEKLIVGLLIFCMMFSHCTTFAAFLTDFSQSDVADYDKNIEMSAYISSLTVDRVDAYVAIPNEEGLVLNVPLKVTNGYVKNPVLSITNLENEVFRIDESRLDCEFIQAINENEITITRLNEGEECLVKIPIVMKDENYYNPFKISSNIEFVLSGVYVDLDSNHFEFSKMTYATLGWDTTSNIQVASDIEKSFEYTVDEMKYMLVQYSIDVELTGDSKSFPVESTNINFKVPTNEALIPQTVSVDAMSTAFTNGLSANEVMFDENNWTYSEENVNISVLNNPVETENNKYIIPQGKDRYIITVIYAVNGESLELTSDILANVRVYNNGSTKSVDMQGPITYNLNDADGKLVTYGVETVEKEVSKGNIFANYNISKDFYETEYTNLVDVNISKADFVNTIEVREKNEYFVDNNEQKYSTENEGKHNTYYKTTTFYKENLDWILGENGKLKILNENGDILLTLDKAIEADENGNIIVNYANRINNIVIRIENPENEGILNIVNTKAIEKLNYNKSIAINLNKLVSEYVAAALYEGDIKDDLGVIKNEINLKNTKTSATISTGRKVLSTLVENKDIELKLGLNNYNEQTDLYKNPVFEITLPKQIEEVKVNDMSILYGNNELDISNIEAYKNDKGNIIIRVSLKGTQTKYSLVELTEGTNILLNVDMKVNIYTPSATEKIIMNYYNENATDYEQSIPWKMDTNKKDSILLNANGYTETEISFIAPSGVVSAQKMSGYNGKNTLHSINQGLQVDRILTNEESKTVTSEVIVMNNSQEVMNNVSILGRTGFKGNTLITNNEDLGTTVDTKMISELSEIYGVYKEVEIYYSENGNATKEISDQNNAWTKDFSSLENIKSYLIVLKDSLNIGEMMVFAYDYTLPANLPCDTGIYTTFNTYYTNANSEYVSEEADTIGLETVSSPKITVDITSNAGETVTAGQMIEYTVTVKNIGEVDAEDINVTLDIPTDTTYVEFVGEGTEEGYYKPNPDVTDINIKVGNIAAGEEKVYTYLAQVKEEAKQVSSAIVKATAEGLDSEDETPEEPSTEEIKTEASTNVASVKVPDIDIVFSENYAEKSVRENADIEYYITVKNNTITSKGITSVKYPDGTTKTYEEYLAEQAEKEANEENADTNEEDNHEHEDEQVEFIRGITLNNIKLEQKIPEGTTFDRAFIIKYDPEIAYDREYEVGQYDASTRTYKLDIGTLKAEENYMLTVVVKSNYIEEIQKEISSDVKITTDESEGEFVSSKIYNLIGRPNLETTFTSNATNTAVKENEEIEYKLTVKNTGIFSVQNLTIKDLLPDELKAVSASYYLQSKPSKVYNIDIIVSDKMSAILDLGINETAVLKLKTRVNKLSQKEVQINNRMSLDSINFEQTKYTDTINTNLQKEETNTSGGTDNSTNNKVVLVKKEQTTQNTRNISYKINGIAWLDKDRNGKRDSGERGLPNISAKLYNANTNRVVAKANTDGSGNYVFNNLVQGKYYIVFGYDTSRYTLTESKKENVDSSINSDVLLTNSLAITDIITISSGNISNIDIGLVEASVFDLSLDKSVHKITVQTEKGTKSYQYNSAGFAKIDIAAKELAGARVYMEYYITVENRGEISGFAKKIVDYLPEGTTFSSDLNPGWYEGANGEIYTDALSETEIMPGERKTIKLVLVKQMTENNVGIISNNAEIAEAYNESAMEDTDSTPGNKLDGEDDLGTADIVISVKTGGNLISGTIVIAFVIVALVGIYIFKKNVLERMRRW